MLPAPPLPQNFWRLVPACSRRDDRMRAALGLCLLLAALLAARAGPAAPLHSAEQQQLFSTAPHPQQRCAAQVPLPAGLSLTDAERELLDYICWPPEGLEAGGGGDGVAAPPLLRRGVPAGVNCTATQWCVPSLPARCASMCTVLQKQSR